MRRANQLVRLFAGRGCSACAIAAAIAASVGLTGCVSYVNWPPQDADVAVHQLGLDPVPQIMAAAVRFVAGEWPIEGRYMVNFPRGTERRAAERAVALIADGAASRVDRVGLDADEPVLHITRVWLRGEEATVDVIRPVGGNDVTQQVSVRLEAGFGERWTVASARAWAVGAYEPPPLFGWGDPGRIGLGRTGSGGTGQDERSPTKSSPNESSPRE